MNRHPVIYSYYFGCWMLYCLIPWLQLVEHFFQSLANTSGMTLHICQVPNPPSAFYSTFSYVSGVMEVSWNPWFFLSRSSLGKWDFLLECQVCLCVYTLQFSEKCVFHLLSITTFKFVSTNKCAPIWWRQNMALSCQKGIPTGDMLLVII
jgi:hypothetical protein